MEDILAAARAQFWESGRCGKGGVVREVVESDAGSDGPRYTGTKKGDSRLGE